MSLRTSRLLALITAALAFTTVASAAPVPPPCALLTPAQIKTVLPTPLLDGKPGSPTAGTTDCTWHDAKGATRVYLSLNDPGITYKAFRDSMLATGRLVPVAGLADDAFYISSAGNSAALYLLKNKHLLLITVDGPDATRVENETAERSLATTILPKL